MQLLKLFMSLNSSVQRLVKYTQTVLAENADLKNQLATALANDKADAQTIADAQLAAEVANIKISELQGLADFDIAEDAELESLIGSVLPAEEPTAEPVAV
jgi:hypothetical protein